MARNAIVLPSSGGNSIARQTIEDTLREVKKEVSVLWFSLEKIHKDTQSNLEQKFAKLPQLCDSSGLVIDICASVKR